MKVQAIGIRIIKKKTRRMAEPIRVARRNSTRKVSNAIIVQSGVILRMSVRVSVGFPLQLLFGPLVLYANMFKGNPVCRKTH